MKQMNSSEICKQQERNTKRRNWKISIHGRMHFAEFSNEILQVYIILFYIAISPERAGEKTKRNTAHSWPNCVSRAASRVHSLFLRATEAGQRALVFDLHKHSSGSCVMSEQASRVFFGELVFAVEWAVISSETSSNSRGENISIVR